MNKRDIIFIKEYVINNLNNMNIEENDLKYLFGFRYWVFLMSRYIWTRSYGDSYYKIIFQAVKLRILDSLNVNSIIKGDLEEEFKRVILLRNFIYFDI